MRIGDRRIEILSGPDEKGKYVYFIYHVRLPRVDKETDFPGLLLSEIPLTERNQVFKALLPPEYDPKTKKLGPNPNKLPESGIHRMSKDNCVTTVAAKHGRNYVTPKDVTEALETYWAWDVRKDVLAVIGKQTKFGVEDVGLCAFIAYRGHDE